MTQPFGSAPLYPQLPRTDWLYMHSVIIRKINAAAGTVDAEGRWLAGQSVSEQRSAAFIAPAGEERTVTTGQAREENVDAIVRVPRNTDVRYSDEVIIEGFSFDLDGQYRILRVGYNPIDLRLMLHRIADDDTFLGAPNVVTDSITLTGQSTP